jgi:hypothetical protein
MRGVAGVDDDPAGHPQVQPERRSVIGLQPHELPPPVRGGETVAGQRIGDLAGRVRTAHVRVAVVDRDDPPSQGGFERLAGSLRLG